MIILPQKLTSYREEGSFLHWVLLSVQSKVLSFPPPDRLKFLVGRVLSMFGAFILPLNRAKF